MSSRAITRASRIRWCRSQCCLVVSRHSHWARLWTRRWSPAMLSRGRAEQACQDQSSVHHQHFTKKHALVFILVDMYSCLLVFGAVTAARAAPDGCRSVCLPGCHWPRRATRPLGRAIQRQIAGLRVAIEQFHWTHPRTQVELYDDTVIIGVLCSMNKS